MARSMRAVYVPGQRRPVAVSRGVGMVMVPVWFAVPPKIGEITLVGADGRGLADCKGAAPGRLILAGDGFEGGILAGRIL